LVVLFLFCVFAYAHSWAVEDWHSTHVWMSLEPAGYGSSRLLMLGLSLSLGILISLMLFRRTISISSDDAVWGSTCALVLLAMGTGAYFLGYQVGYRVAPNLYQQRQFGMSIGATVTAGPSSSPVPQPKPKEIQAVEKPGPTPQE